MLSRNTPGGQPQTGQLPQHARKCARQLAQALSCYRGALVVVSHDVPFLRSAGITRWLRLDRDGRLADAGPP
jgi:hypothetical protein